MESFLLLGNRFQVAGFAISQPADHQNSEESDHEEEIAATISNNMMASEFAGTPSRKSIVEPASPAVTPDTPEVLKKPVPRVTGPAKVQKSTGKPSKAGDSQFLCEFCNNSYQSRKSVTIHQSRACSKNPNLKLYTCPFCNETMKPNKKYMHSKKHTNEKNKA